MIIPRSVLLRMRNFSDSTCRENKKKHLLFSIIFFFFSKIALFMRYEKYGTAGQPTDNSFWLTKATNTHLEYVILICTATMVTRTSLNVTLPDLFLISLGCRDVIPGSYHLESCLEGVQKTRKNLKHYSRSRDSNFSAILADWRSTGSLIAQREPEWRQAETLECHMTLAYNRLLAPLPQSTSFKMTNKTEREREWECVRGGREGNCISRLQHNKMSNIKQFLYHAGPHVCRSTSIAQPFPVSNSSLQYSLSTPIYFSSSSSCSWRVRRVSCSLILKMKLVPPSLLRSSYVPSSPWSIS